MLKRTHYIVLSLVVLLTVVVLKLPSRTAAHLKLAIGSLFLPLDGLSGAAQELAGTAGNAVLPRDELLRQLAQAEREKEELRIRLLQLEAAEQENARLRQYLGLPRQVPWKLKLARVVGRDPANWWRTIRIDAGLRDGMTTNATVLSAEGWLVGRVSEVGYAHSLVALVGDPDCRVSVLIEKTREHGVIAPASSNPLDPSLVDLSFLSGSSSLQVGQKVLTSGLGGVFPKDILVGQIVDFRSVDYGLSTEARVKLAVRMNALEEVWVKLP